MRRWLFLVPALLLAGGILPGQEPGTPAAQAPTAPARQIKAQYNWGYVDKAGQGKGNLAVLVEPGTGRTILELFGMGERLMILEGDRAQGYHVHIPRRKVDQQVATLGAVPLPFFPQVASPEALYRLLAEGAGPGVKVTRRDAKGPVKLAYQGQDDDGNPVQVWLQRTRWEVAPE